MFTLTGAGGIGKTRLAWEVLRIQARARSAWFCDLRAVHSNERVVAAIAAPVAPVGREPATSFDELVTDLGASPDGLLVLDNFEQLLSAASTVRALRTQLPLLRILVTSRARLSIAGERVIDVPPLAPDDAVALYVRRVHELGASPGNDLTLLHTLAARLDGLPLALELAAGRARLLSTEEIVRRTEADLTLLAHHGPVDDARHTTLTASITASWDLLTHAEQHALAACSVFAEDFSIEAAEHVIAAAPGEPPALDLLMALRDKSLLSSTRHRGRLSLYVATRAFATEQLRKDATQFRRATRAHAGYFAARAEELSWSRTLHGTRSDTDLRNDLLRDLHDVANAMETTSSWTGDGDQRAHAALVDAVCTLHGTTPERALELVAPALRSETLLLWQRVRLLSTRRSMLNALGRQVGDDGMDALRLRDDVPATLRAFLHCMNGVQLRLSGLYEGAWTEHEAAAHLLLGQDVPRMLAMNTACMGRLQADFGDVARSRQLNNDARAEAAAVGDRWLEALAIANLAQLAQSEAHWLDAETLLNRALALLEQTRETYYIAIYRTASGDLMQECGRCADGRAQYQAADEFLSAWPGHRCTTLMYAAWAAMEAESGDLLRADFLLAKARKSISNPALANPTVVLGLALHGARVDLARGATSAIDDARALLELNGETLAHSFDLRFAARMLTRALAAREPSREDPPPQCMHIAFNADSFSLGESGPVDLRKRGAMRRILAALVEQHRQAPGTAIDPLALVACAWPDERLSATSASTRLRVAISALRKLGLREVLHTRHEGYLLAPGLSLVPI